MRRRLILGLAVLGVLAYLATGVVVVAPGEAVVVRRFGRPLAEAWPPGLHLGAPLGVDRRDRVRTDAVRTLTVGRAGVPGSADAPGAGEFLTGDLNLVRAEAVLQYRVADPVAFVVRADDPEALLRRLSEAALSRAFAGRGVDPTLREGRGAAAAEAAGAVAREAERYGLGVAVLGLSLTDVRPPTEVAADFASAQSARSERERRTREARTYELATMTAARAEAQARSERARGAAERTVALANAHASRFKALQTEAERARGLTVRRLYVDALREILPRVRRKVLLTPDQPLDLTLIDGGR